MTEQTLTAVLDENLIFDERVFAEQNMELLPAGVRKYAPTEDQMKVFRNFCIEYRKKHKGCKEREVRRALIRKFNITVEK